MIKDKQANKVATLLLCLFGMGAIIMFAACSGAVKTDTTTIVPNRIKYVEDLGELPDQIDPYAKRAHLLEIDGETYLFVTGGGHGAVAICPYQGKKEEPFQQTIIIKDPAPTPQPKPPVRQPEPSNVFSEDDLDRIVPRKR